MKFITLPEAEELYIAAQAELSNLDQDELRNKVEEILMVASGLKDNKTRCEATPEIRTFLKSFFKGPLFLSLEDVIETSLTDSGGNPDCHTGYHDIYRLTLAHNQFNNLSQEEDPLELENGFKHIFWRISCAGVSNDEEIIKETRDLFDQILKSDAWNKLSSKTKYCIFEETFRTAEVNSMVLDLLALNGANEGLKFALDEDEIKPSLSMLAAASTSSNEDIKGAARWQSQKFVESGAFLNPLGIHEKAEIAKAKWQSDIANHVLEAAEELGDFKLQVDPKFTAFWNKVHEEKDLIYHALALQEHLAKTTPNEVLRNTKLYHTLRITRNTLNAVVPEI